MHVRTRLRQVFRHRPGAYRRGVHLLEHLERHVAPFLLLYTGHQTDVIEVADRRNRYARHHKRSRQPATDVDRRQHVLFVGVYVADCATEPSLGSDLVRLAGVPDVHRPEVRAAGVGVADSLHYGHLARVIDILQRRRVGVEAQLVVDGQDLVLRDDDRRTRVVVVGVVVRDEGIQKVVASRKLHDHQHMGLSVCRHFRVSLLGGFTFLVIPAKAGIQEGRALPDWYRLCLV